MVNSGTEKGKMSGVSEMPSDSALRCQSVRFAAVKGGIGSQLCSAPSATTISVYPHLAASFMRVAAGLWSLQGSNPVS